MPSLATQISLPHLISLNFANNHVALDACIYDADDASSDER